MHNLVQSKSNLICQSLAIQTPTYRNNRDVLIGRRSVGDDADDDDHLRASTNESSFSIKSIFSNLNRFYSSTGQDSSSPSLLHKCSNPNRGLLDLHDMYADDDCSTIQRISLSNSDQSDSSLSSSSRSQTRPGSSTSLNVGMSSATGRLVKMSLLEKIVEETDYSMKF